MALPALEHADEQVKEARMPVIPKVPPGATGRLLEGGGAMRGRAPGAGQVLDVAESHLPLEVLDRAAPQVGASLPELASRVA